MTGCNTNYSEQISLRDQLVIENALKLILKHEGKVYQNNCYIVEPYFSDIILSNYFDSNDVFFKKLFEDKSQDEYKRIQDSLNNKNEGESHSFLKSLSTCKRSEIFIGFSEICDDVIMGYVVKVNELMSIEQYKGKYKDQAISQDYYVFSFNKESGKIKDVYLGGIDF